MHLIKHIPLLSMVLLIYNVIAFLSPDGAKSLQEVLFSTRLVSGAILSISIDNALLFIGLLLLFFELMKATRSTSSAIADHVLSTILFIVFLIEFLVVKQAGTSSFLVLMVLAFVDVIAGFTISLQGARRDVVLDHS